VGSGELVKSGSAFLECIVRFEFCGFGAMHRKMHLPTSRTIEFWLRQSQTMHCTMHHMTLCVGFGFNVSPMHYACKWVLGDWLSPVVHFGMHY
jgi:hypothetical protein